MITKCECQHCGQPVEFEASQLEIVSETAYRSMGQTIQCPLCGQETQLYLNKAEFIGRQEPKEFPDWAWIFILIFLIGSIVGLFNGFSQTNQFSWAGFAGGFLLGFLIIFLGMIYFAPSIVGRHKKNSGAIFVLNLLTGWTILGWIGSLVWANMKD